MLVHHQELIVDRGSLFGGLWDSRLFTWLISRGKSSVLGAYRSSQPSLGPSQLKRLISQVPLHWNPRDGRSAGFNVPLYVPPVSGLVRPDSTPVVNERCPLFHLFDPIQSIHGVRPVEDWYFLKSKFGDGWLLPPIQ
ncbi:hypothetical protein AVEN_240906-1 [Araneus ventricosus]|uniref:Uncharacterized protein n=1 Tax=Araneus ventricosus TaxID=182803 RepID=A0A4Y2V655_ARAVE|nr:hypothetical protein AVEN_240906-1 [Araneus ventricosus]